MMEVRERQDGDVLELVISGRMDATWAEHLEGVIAQAVRRGSLRIAADLTGVSYISSAGIGVLVKAYQELAALQGAFWIARYSDAVERILSVVGLLPTLTAPPESVAHAGESLETKSAVLHITELGSRSLTPRLHGKPELLDGCRFGPQDAERVTLYGQALTVGVGAFGDTFEEARTRCGELLAVGGAAVYLPTDGSGVPDFLLAAGGYVPEVQLLYGVSAAGSFARAASFEAKKGRSVPLHELAEAALTLSGAGAAAALVIVGEPSALVGAALRRSPAAGPAEGAPFGFPEMRRWISLTSESGGARRALLAGGVVARAGSAPARLAAYLRPMDAGSSLLAHLHGAAFALRQAQERTRELGTAVNALFEGGTLRSVLHLLADEGEGETELVRGTLWCGPLEVAA